jgi:hypothetical protein
LTQSIQKKLGSLKGVALQKEGFLEPHGWTQGVTKEAVLKRKTEGGMTPNTNSLSPSILQEKVLAE